ncbi:hypothetical protein GYMLUDRAFT_248503 [Collybiopsis luxurians FD-317 M1]|uniref:Terpene synthase n=1 Tax=Collybiopsis luxurians FD-317 M1 TaxID=944289 RepID=A0A0D0CKM9_9AGAR|nr:hypothetical protein GYMLUDRAFT_248503 [Collybiopsis luxurians FD-317 M1]
MSRLSSALQATDIPLSTARHALMEFLHSAKIDPSMYDTEGLCDGIDLRMHNLSWLEDRGSIRAHEDWTKYVSPVAECRGNLDPMYGFTSVTLPECLPGRLELVSYLNEIGFLHDGFSLIIDIIDHVEEERGMAENDEMAKIFLESIQNSEASPHDTQPKQTGRSKIQSQIAQEMLAIDRECATVSLNAWVKFLRLDSSRPVDKKFITIEDFLSFRAINTGEMFWFGMVTFALGLKIKEHEMEKCRELTRSAYFALALQNDLYSWEKEYEAVKRYNLSHIMNTIWILTQEHNTDIQVAQDTCRKLIKKYVAEYVQIVKGVKDDESLSVDLRNGTALSRLAQLLDQMGAGVFRDQRSHDSVVVMLKEDDETENDETKTETAIKTKNGSALSLEILGYDSVGGRVV